MNATARPTRTNKYDANCEKCSTKVIAGTGVLKGRMVGGSRRWLVEHATCPVVRRVEDIVPAPVATPNPLASSWNRRVYLNIDERFIAWIGEMIIEEGSIVGARQAYAAANEFWDGEDSARTYGEARFNAALVPALEQNQAIHGITRCAECDRPGTRAVDCVACQYDSGLDG